MEKGYQDAVYTQCRCRWVVGVAYWNTVSVLLSDSLSFSLALLERVLVLELGTHIERIFGL